jgi:hypothetical protein
LGKKHKTLSKKIIKTKRAEDVVQVVEHLLSKFKALD